MDQPIVSQDNGVVSVSIPISTFNTTYVVDFQALINETKTNIIDKEHHFPIEEQQNKTPRGQKRRRDEEEEYDLDDPFIDDTELPLGITLQDLLSGEMEKEAGSTKVSNEFYVWKGRLPEREIDPLWMEKSIGDRKKTTARKRIPKKKGQASQDDIRKRKEKATTPRSKVVKAKEKNMGKKKKKSISERITELGTADDIDAVMVESVIKNEVEQTNMVDEPYNKLEGSSEEKMRKKFDISTPLMELEYKLAIEGIKSEAQKTVFTDPKKFPSSLRSLVNEAIACCLRRQEKKTELPTSFFEELALLMPFSASSIEKLTYSKLVPLYRDELQIKVIPQLLEEIAIETKVLCTCDPVEKKTRFNEKIRQLLIDLIRYELDRQAFDRVAKSYEGTKPESFSETGIRKAFYPKIAACWPDGFVSTTEIGREYNSAKRRHELKKLKEHGIKVVPTLIPIIKSSKNDAKDDSTKHDSALNSQPDLVKDLELPRESLPSFLEAVLNPETPLKLTRADYQLSTSNLSTE